MSAEAKPLLKPPVLRSGDTVGVVAPASDVDRAALERGAAALERLGYQVVYAESILEREGYFAGSVARRVGELHQMFERQDVRAIVCARGGYGCNYLLPHLDLDLIRRNPKIFVGYSDITALHTWIHDQTGLVTFHGPMVAKDFATAAGEQWAGSPQGVHPAAWECAVGGWFNYDAAEEDVSAVVAGEAEGTLYGGCLSILASSLGTPYEIQTRDTVLLLEDVNAKPYQVDRMLMQLAQAGKFAGVRGVVFGEMVGCAEAGGPASPLREVIARVVREQCPGVPVAFGFRSGHVSRHNITLPLGVRCRLAVRAGDVRLTMLESAVEPAGRDVAMMIASAMAGRGPAQKFGSNGEN